MSRVDVIIPCYMYAHYLRKCAESVLTQSHGDVRVLIIDDCSPDHTEEVARELVAEDSRVEYRRHKSNRGHIATYNEGLDWVDGSYALVLSADDFLAPGALARATRLMDDNPGVGLCYGTEVIIYPDRPLLAVHESDGGGQILAGVDYLEMVCASGRNPVGSATAVVRSSMQKSVGGYRPELPHSGDMEMWLRFAAHAAVGVLDSVQAYRRCHARNMNHLYRGLPEAKQRLAAFESLFRECGDRITDGERLHRRAIRSVAESVFWDASRAFELGEVEVCREMLRFASMLDPTLRHRPVWAKMRCKQLLGHRLWGLIRPTRELLRDRLNRKRNDHNLYTIL